MKYLFVCAKVPFLCPFVRSGFKNLELKRKKYHKKRLEGVIKKYLHYETTEETFSIDLIKVSRLFSMQLSRERNKIEEYAQGLSLGGEARLRESHAIVNLPLVLIKEKIERSMKVLSEKV